MRRLLCATLLAVFLGTSSSAADALDSATAFRPRILVLRAGTMVDDRIAIAVVSVKPGALVRLRLTQQRSDGTWESQATFRANRFGVVYVPTTAPENGDYAGIDPMGLFWSARHLSAVAPALDRWTERDGLTAEIDAREVASVEFDRLHLRPGVRITPVRENGVVGTLFEPASRRRAPAIVTLGGSEGGLASAEVYAAALSSYGYVALALAYFDPRQELGGLPTRLSRIPLEYFDGAIEWLQTQRSVQGQHIGVFGASRGGELALLLGSRHEELDVVVAAAPSSVVWTGFVGVSAWTSGGVDLPFLFPDLVIPPVDGYRAALSRATPQVLGQVTIPVERLNGAVLLSSGKDDQHDLRTASSFRVVRDQVVCRTPRRGMPNGPPAPEFITRRSARRRPSKAGHASTEPLRRLLVRAAQPEIARLATRAGG